MFRKPLKKKGNVVPVKGSEGKRLRKQLLSQFPLLGEEQLDVLWPRSEQLECQKLTGHASIFYSRRNLGSVLLYRRA